MHGLAEDMDLAEIASKSAGGQLFDIKKDYAGVGGLLMVNMQHHVLLVIS